MTILIQIKWFGNTHNSRRWNMNTANWSRSYVIGQMAKHHAVGESGRHIFWQLHLQSSFDDCSQLFDQLAFLFLTIKFTAHRETQSFRWDITIPGHISVDYWNEHLISSWRRILFLNYLFIVGPTLLAPFDLIAFELVESDPFMELPVGFVGLVGFA